MLTVGLRAQRRPRPQRRVRASTRVRWGSPAAPRRLAFLEPAANTAGTRPAVSLGESEYTALILGLRAPHVDGIQFNVNYTLSEAKSTIGTAVDQLNANNIQEADAALRRPARVRSDRPHRLAAPRYDLGDLAGEGGFTVAPIFIVPVGAAGVHHGRARSRTRTARSTISRAGVQFDGVGNAPKGDRSVRDVQLRPRRLAVTDEPAPVEEVPSVGHRAHRGDRRDVQRVQREEPDRPSPPRGCSARDSEPGLHAADRVLRRLPERRSSASASSGSASRSSQNRRFWRRGVRVFPGAPFFWSLVVSGFSRTVSTLTAGRDEHDGHDDTTSRKATRSVVVFVARRARRVRTCDGRSSDPPIDLSNSRGGLRFSPRSRRLRDQLAIHRHGPVPLPALLIRNPQIQSRLVKV